MNSKLIKTVGCKQYQTSISIQDLLVWAIRQQKVMAWLDENQDRIGAAKSQMGMVVETLRLGTSIDRFKSVTNMRMPDDAFAVGVAVLGLSVAERRLVIEHAMAGDAPIRPTNKLVYVNSAGKRICVPAGKMVSREYRDVDGVRKQVRLKVCNVAHEFSHNEFGYLLPIYNCWASALNLLSLQLVDLNNYFLDINSIPKVID